VIVIEHNQTALARYAGHVLEIRDGKALPWSGHVLESNDTAHQDSRRAPDALW
jgi:hypothetical protein